MADNYAVLYRMKHCNVNDDAGAGAKEKGDAHFGMIVQPRNAQGGPRRLLLRMDSADDRARWVTALLAAGGKPGQKSGARTVSVS